MSWRSTTLGAAALATMLLLIGPAGAGELRVEAPFPFDHIPRAGATETEIALFPDEWVDGCRLTKIDLTLETKDNGVEVEVRAQAWIHNDGDVDRKVTVYVEGQAGQYSPAQLVTVEKIDAESGTLEGKRGKAKLPVAVLRPLLGEGAKLVAIVRTGS